MNMDTDMDTDVIVVGAGIVGATVASILGRAGLKVLLMESQSYQASQPQRLLAITPASQKVLKRAGIWEHLPTDEISFFRKMRVWDEGGHSDICFDSASICHTTLGYIISYQAIIEAFHTTLAHMNNIHTLWSVTPTQLTDMGRTICLDTDNGARYHTKIIIAADGGNSKIRKLADIPYRRYSYHQTALTCVVTTEKPHEETAYQRFLASGPLAFLPLLDPHKCAVVWSTTPAHAERLQKLDNAAFHNEIAAAFIHTLGTVLDSTERHIFPLHRALAEHYIRSRVALIGESAHTVHPLAGMGVNLGLLDAATLAELVIASYLEGRDLGRMKVLRRYERWRKTENKNMMYVLDGCKYLFENKLPAVQHLRNFGLSLVNDLPMVKHAMMKHAMGLTGNLPAMTKLFL